MNVPPKLFIRLDNFTEQSPGLHFKTFYDRNSLFMLVSLCICYYKSLPSNGNIGGYGYVSTLVITVQIYYKLAQFLCVYVSQFHPSLIFGGEVRPFLRVESCNYNMKILMTVKSLTVLVSLSQ
jgi:hypothetical protein